MSTPNLRTYVRNQVQRRDAGMQTAFPAKVSAYQANTGTVTLIPQFLEESESDPETITNVPVCFPHYMSWTIDPGTFGLVICTKYSLDRWRSELQPNSPKDLRRFTMSGATFHPVVMGSSPSAAQQFVALAEKVESELGKIKDQLDAYANKDVTPANTFYTSVGSVGSSRVKAET